MLVFDTRPHLPLCYLRAGGDPIQGANNNKEVLDLKKDPPKNGIKFEINQQEHDHCRK